MNEAVLQGRVRGVNRAHELANQLQGDLRIDPKSTDSGINWFNPEGTGETLTLARKRVIEKDGKVIVHTKLGNKFTFRLKETK